MSQDEIRNEMLELMGNIISYLTMNQLHRKQDEIDDMIQKYNKLVDKVNLEH